MVASGGTTHPCRLPPLAQSTRALGSLGVWNRNPCWSAGTGQVCWWWSEATHCIRPRGLRPIAKTSQSTSAVRIISKTASVLPNTNAQVPNSSTTAFLAVARRNSLNLLPEQHSQRRTFGVFSSSLSGDRGKTAAAAEGPWRYPCAPSLQGLSQNASPSRTSQIDQAPTLYILLLIASFDGQGNGQVIGCPARHWLACIPSNAAACEGEPGMGA
jgi:hypothetical protein